MDILDGYIVVYVADWEMWLMTAAQHHKRVSYPLSLTQEKITIQSMVSNGCVLLSHDRKIEKL